MFNYRPESIQKYGNDAQYLSSMNQLLGTINKTGQQAIESLGGIGQSFRAGDLAQAQANGDFQELTPQEMLMKRASIVGGGSLPEQSYKNADMWQQDAVSREDNQRKLDAATTLYDRQSAAKAQSMGNQMALARLRSGLRTRERQRNNSGIQGKENNENISQINQNYSSKEIAQYKKNLGSKARYQITDRDATDLMEGGNQIFEKRDVDYNGKPIVKIMVQSPDGTSMPLEEYKKILNVHRKRKNRKIEQKNQPQGKRQQQNQIMGLDTLTSKTKTRQTKNAEIEKQNIEKSKRKAKKIKELTIQYQNGTLSREKYSELLKGL